MLHVFRIDLGETFKFETELAFQNIKVLKSTIEHEYGILASKQILIISGGELLDDDAVQVSMKIRETSAGMEENPIYLLDKSYLERPRPIQIDSILSGIPTFDNATVEKWSSMPSTYETIVQRADTAQNFNKYAKQFVADCERLIHEHQAQYQGWMAVIANIDDTLSSFLLNRTSFDRSYQSYLTERSAYLELFQSLPHAIEVLHQLKLPNKLVSLINNSSGIYHKSNVSASTSSSSISVEPTTTASYSPPLNENDVQDLGDISLFEWITAQLGDMRIDDIINGCTHVIEECTNELLTSMNKEVDDVSKKISNHELKRFSGIEERFAVLQNQLTQAKHVQREQNDCAAYLVSQKQQFSSNIGNQREWALIKDLSGIHAKNIREMNQRHLKLIEINKKVRKSKQEIIDELHRRFKSIMLLQRHLVDHDTKQSLYLQKLNRTRKTMAFLRQLNQAPNIYYSFLFECVRRKQYSNIFNQFSQTIHSESKNLYKDEITKREQFIKQYEPNFLFNLLPALKTSATFFIREPLPLLDTHLPDITSTELDHLFEQFPDIKEQNNSMSLVHPSINLASLIRYTQIFHQDDGEQITTVPLSVLIPSTTTIIHATITKQIPSPTNSSSQSTVVRSQSSSDVESPNEQILTQTLIPQEENLEESNLSQSNTETSPFNDSPTKSSSDDAHSTVQTSPTIPSIPSTTPTNNEEDDDYIQCSLETVYTSTEMAISPPQRPSTSQQTDNEYIREIIDEFHLLRNQCKQSTSIQHELIINYHQTVLKVITSLQQSNQAHQDQIDQFQSDIQNHLQDNETLKIQYDLSEESKQELTSKCSTLEDDFTEFRRIADIEKTQILKALQSDFEFELEKVRSEHQEVFNRMKTEQENKQIFTTTIDVQTDEQQTCDQQTSVLLFNNQDQSTETTLLQSIDQSIQTSHDENEEIMRRSVSKDQQQQFNLAIQRAVQNATSRQKKQIGQLEQELTDKRSKIIKLKECIKKLQNFYTSSSTPPPILPSIANSLITSSINDEHHMSKDEEIITTSRQAFLKRSEPISMPSTFIVQSMLAAGNAASSPKTEQPMSTTVNNLLMETCFKPSPSESSAAVELYTPFAASPPNQMSIPLSPQTPHPIHSVVSSSPNSSSTSRLTTTSPPQPTPIAFFTVNRSDHVIIYFDQTYQHYMIYTSLPTLHFIHSDCYELFNIPQRQNSSQQQSNINTGIIDSVSTDAGGIGNNNTNMISLINTSMINSTLFGTNGLNPSTTPLLGQVTDKEYCQAKKPNNRFNVPLGTKFYRVRVKPWKPSISSSSN